MGCGDDIKIKVLLDACMKCGKLFEPVYKGWVNVPVPKGLTVCEACAKATTEEAQKDEKKTYEHSPGYL